MLTISVRRRGGATLADTGFRFRLPNRAHHFGQPPGWLRRLLPYERTTDFAFPALPRMTFAG